ncbi:MAG: sugar transferase [Anaerolineales bacterium]|jgi:lipopolysaccharide/colanic/teichoic acid biosynthesis glycosyltransferase|nr:sugar transferase [Chloroflexota bacterium]MBK6647652.1 sugar transferase [Anaerolineales bacterium]
MRVVDHGWIKNFDPEKRWFVGRDYMRLKRFMDLALVLGSSPFWLPVIALSALAVWVESPGAPVFFTQTRTGKGGKLYSMYKFRSMVPNAEELKAKYAHLNELVWPEFKITNDPRVTKVGRILRRTSIDELPQLFNVIKGEMSLVGPRPADYGPETFKLWQTERLDVLPGLTGLWQVTARGAVDVDVRSRLDIMYIERASIWLDIVILFRTVSAVVNPPGAV